MLRHNRALLICCGAILLLGCQVNTVHLSPQFNELNSRNNVSLQSSDLTSHCDFDLVEFTDRRRSKSLGFVATSIVETDVIKWVGSALSHYQLQETTGDEHAIAVKLELIKAYIQSVSSSMAANVVFAVQLKAPSEATFGKKIFVRGHEVDVNWNSGEGEILDTLNKAIAKALKNLRWEISNHCTV